ncbi:MAG: transglycosylase domain-containing protein [Oscillospiraceae bacterium]|nr:transglycosylase domain-containing protein [Oscillospiraceae bacterium]
MKKILIWTFVILTILIITPVSIIWYIGYTQYRDAVDEISVYDAVNEIRTRENFIEIDEISEYFLTAIVAVEDHRFYNHPGIDLLATGNALFVNVASFSFDYGASGITQQLGRWLYFTQDRQASRKVAELFVALDLERMYTKDEILELYVNVIYYGRGFHGIRDASYGFFGVPPSELTFEQATFLAGVPNAPSIFAFNEELGEQRRMQVVRAWERRIGSLESSQ